MDGSMVLYECPYCHASRLLSITSNVKYMNCENCNKASCLHAYHVRSKACKCFAGFIIFLTMGIGSCFMEFNHTKVIWTGAFFVSASFFIAFIINCQMRIGKITYVV